MIKITNYEVLGWEHAIRGMRNPLNSWDKSDSYNDGESFIIGENDFDLAKRLAKAGSSHRKYLRMVTVYADISAPMYWWSEYDTYKVGTVANSCSKMHKLLSKPFEMGDFSFDQLPGYKYEPKQFKPPVDEDNEVWKQIEDADDGWYVSDQGRVRHNKKILSCSVHTDGYIFSIFI